MTWEDDFRALKAEASKLVSDLIEELATGLSVLGHLKFLQAVACSTEPLTVAELATRCGDSEKNIKGRCQLFVNSKWLTKTQKAGQDAYFIDFPTFLPGRTDRLFDSPMRVGEFKALLARLEELEKTAPEAFKQELGAMKHCLAGIIPPLEERAKDLEG